MYSFNKTRLFDWLKIRENNEKSEILNLHHQSSVFQRAKNRVLGQ